MFTDAIVKAPCQNLTQGITTAELGQPDYLLAVQQHAAYVNALRHCGLHVTELEADEGHPDSTFIEDTALVTPACAIITRPGAESRRGETVSVANELRKFFPSLHTIEQPGTLDAGDVMMAGDHYYIGLSSRTNEHGAQQLIAILEHHGLHGSMVPMADGLHLKSSISFLENNRLLTTSSFMSLPDLASFNPIEVPEDEAYAANAIWVNDKVLVAAGYPKVHEAIRRTGLEIIELDMSEFQKVDGGLSCLSLRFSREPLN